MMTSFERLRLWRALTARRSAYVAVVVVCGWLAGCGSSSHTTSSASTATTSAPTSTTGTSNSEASAKLHKLPQATANTSTLPPPPSSVSPATERSYLEAVFNDAQRFWEREFSQAGVPYTPARLVLFANAVHSGCGAVENAGPFYCGADHGVYLDLSFFEALARHAGVGPFGQAYIVGHELGHHVQFVTGIAHQVAALNHQDPSGENARSVRVELQADCLSGVWAHSSHAHGQLSETDLNDAIRTAALVGDDFQQRAAGRVVDSALWTHGSSAQRQQWLKIGFQSGRPGACDTFASR